MTSHNFRYIIYIATRFHIVSYLLEYLLVSEWTCIRSAYLTYNAVFIVSIRIVSRLCCGRTAAHEIERFPESSSNILFRLAVSNLSYNNRCSAASALLRRRTARPYARPCTSRAPCHRCTLHKPKCRHAVSELVFHKFQQITYFSASISVS